MERINGNVIFECCPQISSFAAVVGKKEGQGPLGAYFDRIIRDSYVGKDTFEQAESELLSTAVRIALNKGDLEAGDVDLACCGDLLNQCVASSFAMRPYGIPYIGVYGACSTMALSMIIAAAILESGGAYRAVCAASSHYCTAERQYRFPLEYGSQRPPTAQWTVTGSGACVLTASNDLSASAGFGTHSKTLHDKGGHSNHHSDFPSEPSTGSHGADRVPYLYAARIGRILDYNITDQNNMGAAMAPAVVKLGTKIIDDKYENNC